MKVTVAAALFGSALALSAAPAFAKPVALSDARMEATTAGLTLNSGSYNSRVFVFAPNIAITNQFAVAIAFGGSATATNLSFTSQTNTITIRSGVRR